MADQISNINGVDEFVFTGSRSAIWHRKGQELAVGASIDEWHAQAGFKHSLERTAVMYAYPDDTLPVEGLNAFGSIADKHVIYRSDTKQAMSVVSSAYKLVQPKEVLESFRSLVEGAGFQLSAGGTLYGGRKYWVTADVGAEAIITNGDEMRAYLMLATSCDGSMATTAGFFNTRGVCDNTVRMALAEGGKQYKVSHRSTFDPNALHDAMGIAKESFYDFIKNARKMAAQNIDQVKAREFVQSLLFVPNILAEDQSTQVKNKCDVILSLFNGKGMGSTLDSAQGTAWGLVNAVTEFQDHHAPVRGKDAKDNRFDSAMWGAGDALKTKAFELALQLV